MGAAGAVRGARSWRVPAIAAVGLLAVGTTLVLQRSGPLAPLAGEPGVESPDGIAAGARGAAATESIGAAAASEPSRRGEARSGSTSTARTAGGGATATPPAVPEVAMPPLPPQSAAAGGAAARAAAPPNPAGAESGESLRLRGAAPAPRAPGAQQALTRATGGYDVAAAPPPPVVVEPSPEARMVGPVLAGRVTTPEGVPLANARVAISDVGRATVTDAQGRFRLADVPAGEHTALIQRVGYEPVRLPLHVATSGDSLVSIAMGVQRAALSDVVAGGTAAAGQRALAAESGRGAVAARSAAQGGVVAAPPPPAPPAPLAPSDEPPPVGAVAQRLAGCYRLDIGGAGGASRDSAEAALPGWLHLLVTPAARRPGWLEAQPLLPAMRTATTSAGWLVGATGEVEIVWPAAAGHEVVLRLRGSGEVLAGTAALRPAGGAPEDEREAASVVAVRGVCNEPG